MGRVKQLLRIALKKPVKRLSDEYIHWLTFANAGMLEPGNAYAMDHAIKNLPTGDPVFEIGSFCGLSTNVMRYLLSKYGKNNKIISSDKWIFEGSDAKNLGDSKITHGEYSQFIEESFKRNVKFFSQENIPHTIKVFSDEFFDLWSKNETVQDVFGRTVKLGGPISFAYIDGNHTYEFTKRDFENTDKFLVKGGFILFDDTSDKSEFGCAEFMKEVEANPAYELVMKNPNYLFKKK